MEENKLKTLVIIPTYNEALNIEEIISAIYDENKKFNLNLTILVVDDKSPDNTAQIVRRMSIATDFVELVIRENKTGLKDAYIEGFNYAVDMNYDQLIMMDADGSHNPVFLKDFIRFSQIADVVVGSRYVENGTTKNWSAFRKLLSRGGNIYSQILLGSKIKDMTGGFNLIKIPTLKKINYQGLKSNGYGFQVELKYKLARAGAKIVEIPITFVDRVKGESKFNMKILIEAMIKIPLIRFYPK